MVNRRKIFVLSVFCIVVVALAIFLAIYFINGNAGGNNTLMVETSSGLFRGSADENGGFNKFLGIPYAFVNASNPFGPSIPVAESGDIFEAYDDEKICPQSEDVQYPGIRSLDCLNLNVFVPNKINAKNLPVMVYIHGGSLAAGSGREFTYGPKFITRHDVILVTINYRVGIYGFMCLDIPEVPGNQGLKDQATALRWIKRNVHAFGGDNNKITIFGQSAGARSVDFHLMSEQEKLFDQAILQSGNSMCHPGLAKPDNSLPLALATYFNNPTDSIIDALSYLSKQNITDVVKASSELGFVSRACVENKYDNVESIINVHPLKKDLPKIKNTPIIIGNTNNEKIEEYINKATSLFKADLISNFLQNHFNFDNNTLERTEDIVKRFYLGDEPITEEVREKLSDFASDMIYTHPQQRRFSDFITSGATVYFYLFSHDGDRNYIKLRDNLTYEGASHADELSYLFDMANYTDEISATDAQILNQLTAMWTNFAKYGNPTPQTTNLLPVKWEPVTKDILYYLNINVNMTLSNRPSRRRLTFWDLFYKIFGDLQLGLYF